METPQTPATALDAFLSRAAVEGERAIAWIRLVVVLLLAGQFLGLAGGAGGVAAGEPESVWILCVQIFGVAFSVWTLIWLRSGRRIPYLLELSVAVDALLPLLGRLPLTLWPEPGYHGFLSMPVQGFFLVALIASGFRRSGRAVWVSGLLTGAGSSALLTLDLQRSGDALVSTTADYAAFWILLVGSFLLAHAVVIRTRSLVTEGAQAALEAERARQRLGVYVSQEIADAAMASEDLRPGGERRAIAVLFSDLRGFTSYSEKLPPEQLLRELNAYLDAMVQVIREEGGVIDKYIGDAIMVVFGIPRARPDDAERAVRTAWRMQRALDHHNKRRAAMGLRPLRQGVGVHYGEAVAGNIGTADRLQYTVVGDAVNLASRLESATKELGVAVLLSSDAARAAGAIAGAPALQSCGSLSVRGRQEALEVLTFKEEPTT